MSAENTYKPSEGVIYVLVEEEAAIRTEWLKIAKTKGLALMTYPDPHWLLADIANGSTPWQRTILPRPRHARSARRRRRARRGAQKAMARCLHCSGDGVSKKHVPRSSPRSAQRRFWKVSGAV